MEFLSSNLKYLRKKRDLSQKALAVKLKVSSKKMEQAEKDQGNTPLDLMLAIASFFKISLDVLVHVDLDTKNKKASSVKLFVLDIDGVLTDGGMYYTEAGDEFKKFDSKDGLAIKKLVRQGMQVAFLSNGINAKLIKSRAKLLGVQRAYVGLEEKTIILDKWVKELKISYKNVAYIGDDFNDLQVIKKAGFTACPANATDIIKKEVDVVLSRNGGEACVREMIDLYL